MRFMIVMAALAACAGVAQEAEKPAAEPKTYVLMKQGPEQQDLFLQEVAAFLEKAGHFYLATYDGEAARVRPIRYTFILDNRLLFATSKKKEMFDQLIRHPKVELSRTALDNSAYLRFKGRAVLCEDADIRARVLAAHPNFEKSFGENLALFAVEPELGGLFPMKGGQPKTKSFAR